MIIFVIFCLILSHMREIIYLINNTEFAKDT